MTGNHDTSGYLDLVTVSDISYTGLFILTSASQKAALRVVLDLADVAPRDVLVAPVMDPVAPKLLTAEAAVALMQAVLVPGWITVGAA